MKKINNYIVEKLRLGKNLNVGKKSSLEEEFSITFKKTTVRLDDDSIIVKYYEYKPNSFFDKLDITLKQQNASFDKEIRHIQNLLPSYDFLDEDECLITRADNILSNQISVYRPIKGRITQEIIDILIPKREPGTVRIAYVKDAENIETLIYNILILLRRYILNKTTK